MLFKYLHFLSRDIEQQICLCQIKCKENRPMHIILPIEYCNGG